jgi:hypothetical protein
MSSSSQRFASREVSLRGFNEDMTYEQLKHWLTRELGRAPEQYDLFNMGKFLYQNGAYLGASKVLQRYVEGPGAEIPGRHLLGYSYYMINEYQEALHNLKKTANRGFDNDWQLLVEIQLSMDQREQQTQQSAFDAMYLKAKLNNPSYNGESDGWKDAFNKLNQENEAKDETVAIMDEQGKESDSENSTTAITASTNSKTPRKENFFDDDDNDDDDNDDNDDEQESKQTNVDRSISQDDNNS